MEQAPAKPSTSWMAPISLALAGHGTFTVTAAQLDRAMVRYLPGSPRTLRRLVEERTGLDYSDVREVSSLLVVLADSDGPL